MNENEDGFSLIPSFYFKVEIDGEQVSFQEVSGLEASMETETIIEGGNNLFTHKLPVRQSYGNLTLSKGVVRETDDFYQWISSVLLEQETISNSFHENLRSISIDLMSPGDQTEVRSWQIVNAYPVKWSISSLNAEESKITIESVELAFQYLTSQ